MTLANIQNFNQSHIESFASPGEPRDINIQGGSSAAQQTCCCASGLQKSLLERVKVLTLLGRRS